VGEKRKKAHDISFSEYSAPKNTLVAEMYSIFTMTFNRGVKLSLISTSRAHWVTVWEFF